MFQKKWGATYFLHMNKGRFSLREMTHTTLWNTVTYIQNILQHTRETLRDDGETCDISDLYMYKSRNQYSLHIIQLTLCFSTAVGNEKQMDWKSNPCISYVRCSDHWFPRLISIGHQFCITLPTQIFKHMVINTFFSFVCTEFL